ncbi:hypothetical protein Btru_013626 [Bulinus truncatus]|nr:hypothetical protein Btru_013626 [Bulinus truncatus]
MATSLLSMAPAGLPVTWTLAPSIVYATFIVPCLILNAADITFSAVAGAVASPEFIVKRNGQGLAAHYSPYDYDGANSAPRKFSAHVSSRTLSAKNERTYTGPPFKHASVEIAGAWSIPVGAADIFQLERQDLPEPALTPLDRRKEKDKLKQKYRELMHRINASLSRKRFILSKAVRALTDVDRYPKPAGIRTDALDRSLFDSLEIPEVKIPQLEGDYDNNSVVEAFPMSSRAWVVSNNVWAPSNHFLPMYGKGIMYSGGPIHGKRHARSVDNDTDEEKSEDVLLTEALHHIEDIRSQSAPCAETGEKIVLLKNMKLNPQHFHRFFADVVNKTVQMANTISDLLMFSDNPPESYMNVFYAMTQSLVETGPMVRGCAIAFNISDSAAPSTITTSPAKTDVSAPASTPGSSKKPYVGSLFPYSYRTREGEVVVTDLSRIYHFHRTAWFAFHANKSTDGLLKPRNRILTNKTDVGYLFPFINKWSKAVSVSAEDGFWAVPYYDCQLKNWVIQYSVPFYQQNGSVPEFKTREGEVVVTDLSRIYHFHRTAWFAFHANKSTDGLLKPRNRILTNKTDVGYLFPFINKWSKAVSVYQLMTGLWSGPT